MICARQHRHLKRIDHTEEALKNSPCCKFEINSSSSPTELTFWGGADAGLAHILQLVLQPVNPLITLNNLQFHPKIVCYLTRIPT